MSTSWPTKPLGDLCNLINGRAFKPSDWGTEGLPIVRIQNLNDADKPFNYFKGLVTLNHSIDTGEVLLSWSGTPGTSFGCFRWERGPGVLNQHIFKVIVDDEQIDGDFFIAAVNSRLEEMISKAHGGVGLRHITKSKLEAIHLPVPSLAEQRRIVDRIKECMVRIDEIDDLRAEAVPERIMLRRSFYSETYSDLLQIHPTKKLGELGTASGGGTPSKNNAAYWNGEIPWISPKDMKKSALSDSTLHISKEAIKGSAAKLIPAGSVLFVVRGMILAHTLPVAINLVDAAINQDMKAITAGDDVLPEFLATMIRGAERQMLSKVEIAGHGTCRLQTEHWSSLPIPVPNLDEQQEIMAKVAAFESFSDALCNDLKSFDSTLRDAILRKAFAGEL